MFAAFRVNPTSTVEAYNHNVYIFPPLLLVFLKYNKLYVNIQM